jgi:cobalt/nickel transport system permease protein
MPPEAAPDASLTGPIRDPRLRLVALALLVFAFSALHAPVALAAMLVLTIVLACGFGLTVAALARALRWPALVVGALVLMLPFSAGATELARLGPLALRAEGLAAAITIALRFLCIFALIAALIGPVPVPRLIAALRGLGLPAIMADMALLTLRHAEDLRRDFGRMRLSMRLRAAYGPRPPLQATGWALASLILRSHARSDRVWHAMRLRGHGAATAAPPTPFVRGAYDRVALVALALAALALLALDRLP